MPLRARSTKAGTCAEAQCGPGHPAQTWCVPGGVQRASVCATGKDRKALTTWNPQDLGLRTPTPFPSVSAAQGDTAWAVMPSLVVTPWPG